MRRDCSPLQVVGRIHQAAMSRGCAGAAHPFHLYADEFQLFASSHFAEMLAEGRKFGLSVMVAHQFAQQSPESVLRAVVGNVGTTVLFRVGAYDSEFFAPLYSPAFGQRDLVSLPNYRAYVGSGPGPGAAAFNVDVPPPADEIEPQYAGLCATTPGCAMVGSGPSWRKRSARRSGHFGDRVGIEIGGYAMKPIADASDFACAQPPAPIYVCSHAFTIQAPKSGPHTELVFIGCRCCMKAYRKDPENDAHLHSAALLDASWRRPGSEVIS